MWATFGWINSASSRVYFSTSTICVVLWLRDSHFPSAVCSLISCALILKKVREEVTRQVVKEDSEYIIQNHHDSKFISCDDVSNLHHFICKNLCLLYGPRRAPCVCASGCARRISRGPRDRCNSLSFVLAGSVCDSPPVPQLLLLLLLLQSSGFCLFHCCAMDRVETREGESRKRWTKSLKEGWFYGPSCATSLSHYDFSRDDAASAPSSSWNSIRLPLCHPWLFN